MQKSAKLINSGQRIHNSRRKGKTVKFSIIDVKQTQDYLREIRASQEHNGVSSLLPSVNSVINQMKRIMSIEFPHMNLDDVFVKTPPTPCI